MKVDLHVHTSEVSLCGHMTGAETVERYSNAGYGCIVITNHFNTYTADHYRASGVEDFFAYYKDMYLLAEKAGERYGVNVLNGYEIRFDGADSDFLVFGMPDEIACDCRRLFKMDPHTFGKLAREHGFLFYQAHPFRNNMKITAPSDLFGIEVKNGNPRHDSRNDIALMWAEKFGLHMTAGSDCHQQEDVAVTGVITEREIKTEAELIEMLRTDSYRII